MPKYLRPIAVSEKLDATYGLFVTTRVWTIAMLALSFQPWFCLAAGAPPATKPSILLVTVDDLGLQLGCYGNRMVTTPHIDRLASEGARFTRAFVTHASCSPSRSSMLTGLYPHQNGQIGLAHLGYAMSSERHANLPGEFRKMGYYTGLIGKLHVAPEKVFPFEFVHMSIPDSRDPSKTAANLRRFLKSADGRPFFLMLNLFDPHRPFLQDVDGSPATKVTADQVRLFDFLDPDTRHTKKQVAEYYTCINRADEIVGRVMQVLAEQGASDNLLVALVGDNGPPFERAKCWMYEAGLQVPCILWYPRRISKGTTSDALVSLVDLMPTFLEAAGAEIPAGLAGRPLWPVLRGDSSGWRQTLAAEYTSHEPDMYYPQRSIRNDRYKLVVSLLHDPAVSTRPSYDGVPLAKLFPRYSTLPPVELYDLKQDPHERHNLAGSPDHQGILNELKQALHRWQKETNDPLLDPKELDKLTAWQIGFGESYATVKATQPQ